MADKKAQVDEANRINLSRNMQIQNSVLQNGDHPLSHRSSERDGARAQATFGMANKAYQ